MRPFIAIALLLTAFAVPAQAGTSAVWDTVANSVFPLLAAVPGTPVECTGWYIGPVASKGGSVALYATAGHCPSPLLVKNGDGLEATAVLGDVSEPGSDGLFGVRSDPRVHRTFLSLAAGVPIRGSPAIVLGWSGQSLTASHLVFAGVTANGLLAYRSDLALRPGLSGAPIVSLATGQATGIVVAGKVARDEESSHLILATPASVLRTLLGLVAARPETARR